MRACIFCLALLTVPLGEALGSEVMVQGRLWQLTVADERAAYLSPMKEFLERADAAYTNFFASIGLKRQQNRILRVRIFPDQNQYRAFRKANSNSGSEFAFYSLFNAEIYTWSSGDVKVLLKNAFHETTHHYMREYIPRESVPRCLDEGIAEIFEMATLEGQELRIGQREGKHAETMRLARSAGHLQPFLFFLKMPVKEYIGYKDDQVKNLHISQCWAISYFLYFEQRGLWRPVLRRFLEESGGSKGAEQILRESLFGGYQEADLIRQWDAFVAAL